MPSGPRKLGGNSEIMSALSPVQAAAMAAERRMYDDLWCGSHDQSGIDDSDDVIILQESPNLVTRDGKNSKGSCSNTFAEPSTSSGIHIAARDDRTTSDALDSSKWECGACTLLNQASFQSAELKYPFHLQNCEFIHGLWLIFFTLYRKFIGEIS